MPVGVGVVGEMGARTAGTGVADRRAVGVGHDAGGGGGRQNFTGIFPRGSFLGFCTVARASEARLGAVITEGEIRRGMRRVNAVDRGAEVRRGVKRAEMKAPLPEND